MRHAKGGASLGRKPRDGHDNGEISEGTSKGGPNSYGGFRPKGSQASRERGNGKQGKDKR